MENFTSANLRRAKSMAMAYYVRKNKYNMRDFLLMEKCMERDPFKI